MPVNRNALIRYKTIDNCLRNPYRRWTLEDLVDACSDALYEYEGIDKGISKRAVTNGYTDDAAARSWVITHRLWYTKTSITSTKTRNTVSHRPR